MQLASKLKARSFYIPAPLLALALRLAVACGDAATAPASASDAEQEAADTPAVATEKEPAAQEEKEQMAAPTPTPEPVGAAAETIKKKDRITLLASSFGNEVYNSRFSQGDTGLWWYPMQARLIHTNHDLELTDEGVISHWEATDNNLGWELTLREGLTFHNGDPITPEDIAFSLKWSLSEKSSSVSRVRTAKVIDKHAHVTGPNTVKILFKQPYATLPVDISEVRANGGEAGILHSKAYWDSVGGVEGYEQNPSPGAAGPFLQTSHLRGEEVVY
jgi:ABC-type transport system substrate-binding protein